MITLLAWIGVILSGLLLTLLLVPVHVRAAGEVYELEVDGGLVIGWGFGLLSVRVTRRAGGALYLCGVRVTRFEKKQEDEEKRRRREEKKREKKERRKAKRRERGGSSWGMRRAWAARHAFGQLLRTLHLRGRVEGVIGLTDPYETALALQVVRAVAAALPAFELDVDADWMDEALDLEGEVRARVWPIETLVVGLGLLLRRDTRRILLAR